MDTRVTIDILVELTVLTNGYLWRVVRDTIDTLVGLTVQLISLWISIENHGYPRGYPH